MSSATHVAARKSPRRVVEGYLGIGSGPRATSKPPELHDPDPKGPDHVNVVLDVKKRLLVGQARKATNATPPRSCVNDPWPIVLTSTVAFRSANGDVGVRLNVI